MIVPKFSTAETGISTDALSRLSNNRPLNIVDHAVILRVVQDAIAEQNARALRIDRALAPLRTFSEGGQRFVQLEAILVAEVGTARKMLAESRLTEKQTDAIEATAHTLYQCAIGA